MLGHLLLWQESGFRFFPLLPRIGVMLQKNANIHLNAWNMTFLCYLSYTYSHFKAQASKMSNNL